MQLRSGVDRDDLAIQGRLSGGGANGPAERIEIGLGSRDGDTGLQASDEVHGERVETGAGIEGGAKRVVGTQRHPEVAGERLHDPGEPFPCHADDRERPVVDRQRAADDVRGRAKPFPPEGMREDHDRRRLGTIVGRRQDAATRRGHSEEREIVSTGDLAEPMLGLAVDPKPDRHHLKSGEPLQRGVAIPVVEIQAVARVRPPPAVDADDSARIAGVNRLQEERVHEREDGGVGADAECQHEDRDGREAGRSAERPQSVAQILQQALERAVLPHVGDRLLEHGDVPELTPGPPLRLRRCESGPHETVLPHLDVQAHFLFDSRAHRPPAEQPPHSHTRVDECLPQPVHATSGSMTRSMA